MSTPKAKYFCENCGAEVAYNARFCPKCGKFFSSVRCPKCGCTGDVKKFINGCPQCGYAMSLENNFNGNKEADLLQRKNTTKKSKKMLSRKYFDYSSKNKKDGYVQVNEDAPAWLFVICIVVLLGIIFLIFWQLHS